LRVACGALVARLVGVPYVEASRGVSRVEERGDTRAPRTRD
jgi:hypothetical protein